MGIVREIKAKSVLSKSKIYRYVINPYVGCQFGCSYCYARFMKKFTGHTEPWGEFTDVKINAPELLLKEINKNRKDQIWISGVCDPYQPLEAEYGLTGKCLKILIENDWPVFIQTKSPLVLRDLDLLVKAKSCDAGFSIATADDEIRKIFESRTPGIAERIEALKELHNAGIRTYAMLAPLLPGAEKLVELLAGKVDYLYVDRMNYNYADSVYKKHNLEAYLSESFFRSVSSRIEKESLKLGIECNVVF